MIEVHWVKAPCCCGQIYHDEIHGTFKTVDEAMKSIQDWWDKNNFKPRYVRQMIDECGDLWWDYGPHNAFYVLKEVPA